MALFGGNDGVAHFAHLGGMAVGFLYLKLDWRLDFLGTWIRQQRNSRRIVQDVKKLWTDRKIRHAGLLLVLFTQDQAVAEHDVLAWHRRCLDRGFPVAPPASRGFRITDRIGNGYCAVAHFGVRGV